MHVNRQRRSIAGSRPGFFGRGAGRRVRFLAAGAAALPVAGGGMAYASTEAFGTHRVGETTGQGLLQASDQAIRPVGERLLVNNGKLLASTVSPYGHHLAALTTDRAIALTIVDLTSYKVLQPRADGPLHLVRGTRLDHGLPGGEQDPHTAEVPGRYLPSPDAEADLSDG